MDQEKLDRLATKLTDYEQRVAQLRQLLNINPPIPTTQPTNPFTPCWFCKFKVWFKENVIGISSV